MATIKAVLIEYKKKQNGEAPIALRITQNRKSRFIQLGFYSLPEHFDKKRGLLRKSHPNARHLNLLITHKLAEAQEKIINLELNNIKADSSEIRNQIQGKAAPDFFALADKELQKIYDLGKIGTYRKSKGIVDKLRLYTKNQPLPIEKVTVSFLEDYEAYLRNSLNNKTNTVHSNLKYIRKLMNDAVNQDIIPYDKNPFLRYKLKTENVEKVFLTEEEIDALYTLEIPSCSIKYHQRNLFVFCCYAGGLRISDALQLQWKDFDGKRIVVFTKKTKTTVSTMLPARALDIINLYKPVNHDPNKFIFPLLKCRPQETDPEIRFKAISSVTSRINTDIKTIAKLAGIDKSFGFHTSRHTFCTLALKKGIPLEYVSKIVGHQSIKTTQVYAKIVNADLDKAMEVFDKKNIFQN